MPMPPTPSQTAPEELEIVATNVVPEEPGAETIVIDDDKGESKIQVAQKAKVMKTVVEKIKKADGLPSEDYDRVFDAVSRLTEVNEDTSSETMLEMWHEFRAAVDVYDGTIGDGERVRWEQIPLRALAGQKRRANEAGL